MPSPRCARSSPTSSRMRVGMRRPRSVTPRWQKRLREEWHRGLMRVYAAMGERGLALRQYQACRSHLRSALEAEPSELTRQLYEQILSGVLGIERSSARLTICFTDVCGSTQMAERLGDRAWSRV